MRFSNSRSVPETVRRVEGERLVYYSRQADPEFWDGHWLRYANRSFYHEAERGHAGPLNNAVLRYATDGFVVEAGCGLGQLVLALQRQGRKVVGVEWGRDTLRAARQLYPELTVHVGDVARLGLRDGSCATYLSVGVVEHEHAGPSEFLREAHRVLSPDGVAIIAVPYFNSLRRRKAHRGAYQGSKPVLPFYQYAFTEDEFSSLLTANGLEPVERFAYGCAKGLRDELRVVRWLFRVPGLRNVLEMALGRTRVLERRYGHMLVIICRRRS